MASKEVGLVTGKVTVHHIRKDNKWICKVCAEKQSVKRHYGLGTGKDCRLHVQKLNKLKGEKEGTQYPLIESDNSSSEDQTELNHESTTYKPNVPNSQSKSKWAAFIDNSKEKVEENEAEYYDDKKVVLEIPQKRKLNKFYRQPKYSKKLYNMNCEIEPEIKNEHENYINSIPNEDIENFFVTNQKINIPKTQSPAIEIPLKEKLPQTSIETKPQIQLKKVSRSSKWAQFLDVEEQNENQDIKESLFSLCDDNDIDTVLDF